MQITVHKSLSEINPSTWDELASESAIFYNYGWFKSFENEISREHLYIVLTEGNKTKGILPGYIVRDPGVYTYHNPRDIMLSDEFIGHALDYMRDSGISRVKKGLCKSLALLRPLLNPIFFPAIIFVSPLGYMGDVLVDRSDANCEAFVRHLVDSAENVAVEMGMKCVLYPWVSDTDSPLLRYLSDGVYIPSYGKPIFELDIEWDTFDKYLNKYLNSNRRKCVKKEIKCFNDTGLTINELSNSEALTKLDKLAALVSNHLKKYEHSNTLDDVRASLLRIYENMPAHTKTFCVESAGNIIGYLLAFLKNGVLFPKFIGISEEGQKGSYTYFNLAYYNLIEKAAERINARKIYYGYASESVKLERGCKSFNSHCYYKFTNKYVQRLVRMLTVRYNSMRYGHFCTRYAKYVLKADDSFLSQNRAYLVKYSAGGQL